MKTLRKKLTLLALSVLLLSTSCNFAYRFLFYVEEGYNSYPCIGVYEFEINVYSVSEDNNIEPLSSYYINLQLNENNELPYLFWDQNGRCNVSIPIKGLEYGGKRQIEIFGRDSSKSSVIAIGKSPIFDLERSADTTSFSLPLYRNCKKLSDQVDPDSGAYRCATPIQVKPALTFIFIIKSKQIRENYNRFFITIDNQKRSINNDKSGVIVLTNYTKISGTYQFNVPNNPKSISSGKYKFSVKKLSIGGKTFYWGVQRIVIQ